MADDETGDDSLIFKKAIESCVTAQAMIDINAEHLDGLRTQCTTTAEITQHEIRTLENKLLWLFSRQLTAKKKCSQNRNVHQLAEYPKLKQWLQVIGLKINTIESTCKHIDSLEDLLQSTENELNKLLHDLNVHEDEIRRLLIAQRNLKSYAENQIYAYTPNPPDQELPWDSWNQNYFSRPLERQADECSLKCDSSVLGDKPESNYAGQISHYASVPTGSAFALSHGIDRRYTPPPTPSMVKKGDRKFPTTPPPSRKHQTNLLPDAFPLTKSKSHEEQLSNRIEPVDSAVISCENLPRRRLATEPGLETMGLVNHHGQVSHVSSPSRSPPFASPDQPADSCFIDDTPAPSVLPVPRSPRTRGMAHIIYHRFTPTVKVTTCHLCDKPMIIGYKCKECKFRCHRDCVDKVPPSCGLPSELVEVFVQSVRDEEGEFENEGKKLHNPHMNVPGFACPDSSSNTSSCNSSSPSSPALIITSAVSHTPPVSNLIQHFNFPEINDTKKESSLEGKESTENELVETQKSNDSDKTTSGTSGSTDSEKTLAGRVDSQDSQVSDADPNDKGWPRQNSLSMREWDIPYDELQISDKIGTGRFGTVCRGNWHGNVAVKMINMDPLDDKRTLDTFKQEVATFRKTRHENLVLFMGACMKPPHLAIVTSLCKGMTLYTHIHLRKDKFTINRTLAIARQITQGMGYLHARGIVHKDLKTKNIFFENGKVVITDFGLFSLTKLCERSRKGEWLAIPKGWLCYLAPEVIRSLRADNEQEGDFPFSVASDVYAFGTVWYELLCGDWPFQGLPPESVIWQVGKGIRQSLANIHSSKDIKDLIMICWAYKPADRPDFSKIQDVVLRQPLVPKKRLARSPSHPVHLSRSAESVF